MLVERLAVSRRRSASVLCLSPFIWTMAVKPLLVQLGLVVLLTDETVKNMHMRDIEKSELSVGVCV